MYVVVVIYLVRSDSSTTAAGTATAARPRPVQSRPGQFIPSNTTSPNTAGATNHPASTAPVPRRRAPYANSSCARRREVLCSSLHAGSPAWSAACRRVARYHHRRCGGCGTQLIPPHRERPPQWCSIYCHQAARSMQRSSVVVFRPHSPSPSTSDRGVRVRQQSRLTAAELDALRL